MDKDILQQMAEKTPTLQESFLRYKLRRQEAIRQAQIAKNREQEARHDTRQMEELRLKFVEQAKAYFGVPYAKKYWKEDEPEYQSPLFLDCCGLIRRVLRDLQPQFGFEFGPWNQAYQYDTLPITLSSTEEMRPGDLVFIAATYYNPKSKRQKHDMVHVEIWLGDGDKTIGARWQRGKVQVHESYMFEAKSYHSPKYIFKSIDTWLIGICESHCSEHKWRLPNQFKPNEKSIFYSAINSGHVSDEDASQSEDEVACDCSSKCSCETSTTVPSIEGGAAKPFIYSLLQYTDVTSESKQEVARATSCPTCKEGVIDDVTGNGNGTKKSLDTDSTLVSTSRIKSRRKAKAERNARLRELSLPTNMATYQICGANGGHIVDAHLSSLGWKKIVDKHNYNWKLKWLEVNNQVNFGAFKDGEQLVNRIPNCSLLTNKLGLFNSLSEYSRVLAALKGDRVKVKMSDFVPETYRIDNVKDREIFLEIYKDGEIWICKPTGLNQGKGIFLIRSQEQVDKMLVDREQRKQTRRTKPLMPLIVQRYIAKPLLVEKKKFDIRSYMVIPSTMPFIVLYHKGYVRVTCEEYDLDSLDLSTHLTNQFVQKHLEQYKDMKEDTVWSMEKFNDYINSLQEEKGIEQDWVLTHLDKQIKSIMKYCFNSVKHKLQSRLGLFDIYGLDFMVDENMKVWLIEINVNPALHTNCEVLKQMLPGIVSGTVDLALECFEKSKKNQPLLPLQNQRTFQMLYNACPKTAAQSSIESQTANPSANAQVPSAKASQSPIRSQAARRSLSPSKDQSWGYISRAPVKSTKTELETSPTKSTNNPANSSNSAKPNSTPITGTNYIKNNIANLGSIAANSKRRSRMSRVDSKYTGIVCSEEDNAATNAPASTTNYTANSNLISDIETDSDSPKPIQESGEEDGDSTYHKPLVNTAPIGPQQISARARRSTQTTTPPAGSYTISNSQPASSQPAPAGWKSPEQILRELKEFRPKTPLLPPLYTIRSDVATSRPTYIVAHHPQLLAGINPEEITLRGHSAILGGENQLASPVRLCMVHAAGVHAKPHRNDANFTTVRRKYPRDRAS